MAKVDYEKAVALITAGKTNKEIAALFQCDPSAISHIRRGFVQGARTSDAQVARFKEALESSVVYAESGCWLLMTSIRAKGYAARSFKGRQSDAHRASYEAYVGEIPVGMQVLHRCDVRNCVNPKHLFLGTNSDNMQDMLSKGRGSVGERHYKAVLTDELVRKLRSEYQPGDSWMELERKTGINRGVLRPAILGITWKHVK